MRATTTFVSLAFGLILTQSALAGGSDPGWKATTRALKAIQGNVQAKARLGAMGSHLELGQRNGTEELPFTAFNQPMGRGHFRASLPAKVEWRENLLLTPQGLEVHRLSRVALPKESSIEALRAKMAAEFAWNPTNIHIPLPDIEEEHEPFGPFELVYMKPVKAGLFGSGQRLKAEEWGHLTAESIREKTAPLTR